MHLLTGHQWYSREVSFLECLYLMRNPTIRVVLKVSKITRIIMPSLLAQILSGPMYILVCKKKRKKLFLRGAYWQSQPRGLIRHEGPGLHPTPAIQVLHAWFIWVSIGPSYIISTETFFLVENKRRMVSTDQREDISHHLNEHSLLL